jgi:hypothetical protein
MQENEDRMAEARRKRFEAGSNRAQKGGQNTNVGQQTTSAGTLPNTNSNTATSGFGGLSDAEQLELAKHLLTKELDEIEKRQIEEAKRLSLLEQKERKSRGYNEEHRREHLKALADTEGKTVLEYVKAKGFKIVDS